MLDLDGFKAINDTLGHQAGDDLLCVIAGRLEVVAGDSALVARLGGDEFAILAVTEPERPGAADAPNGATPVAGVPRRRADSPDAACDRAQEQALELADRLLSVFDEPVSLPGARLRLGGSLGISIGPRDGHTGSDLMRNADIAMYAAKAASSGLRVFSDDLVEMTATSLTLASDLRDAVTQDGVGIAVQPLIDLASGAVHSLEVLARWTHPELGEIAPEAFFMAAERSGQVAMLSARILDRALDLCAGLQASGQPVRVAVNLAPRWLADPSLPEQVGLALARHGVPADLLCLEITESSVIADPRRAVDTLGRLRDMGVHLSVDDFGTGYSSLTYLSRLPVDQMKIDKSFVMRLHESPRDRAIAQSILDLGRNLGLEVVAEGVTEDGTFRALQEMGCAIAQGYLMSRPIQVDELPALLARLGAVSRVAARPPGPRREFDMSGFDVRPPRSLP
jgi:predicted signal transduction protein with EAL and GGDEF domain